MKHATRRLCYLIFCVFFLVACSPAIQELKPASPSTGLLWKINKPGYSESYLFGTIHSDDERVINLPPQVQAAFQSSPSFALELILNESAIKTVMAHQFFSDDNSLKKVVGEALYKRSIAALSESGIPEQTINQMKPWVIFTILNMPKNESGTFLDAMLYQQALDADKIVTGLETSMEQVDVFDGLSYDIQTQLLEKTLDQLDDMQSVMDEIIDVYLSRDLEKILAIAERYNQLMGEELAEIFNKRLLTDRNIKMAERALPLLRSGKVFIAVGALHLPGEDGLIVLFQKQGFSLEPIPIVFGI